MIAVVLAGGRGARLWPESRQQKPKQLCSFVDNRSMLDHTIDRLNAVGAKKIIIITNDDLKPQVADLVNKRSDQENIQILSEPYGKNTAPAIGLALTQCYPHQMDEVIGIFPSDHHVLDLPSFQASIDRATAAALQGHLSTIGIAPQRPETGFGYIEKTKWEVGNLSEVFAVNSFCEKPDLITAQTYLESGNHMWNSGIYIGKAQVFWDEFEQYLPQIHAALTQGYENYLNSYFDMPEISLDYGIAEKSSRIVVVPASFGWCDLGSWNALAELSPPDADNNICSGQDVITLDSNQCIVKQTDKPVVLFGVENLLVVETDQIFFIADRNRCQDVRAVVDRLQKQNRIDLL